MANFCDCSSKQMVKLPSSVQEGTNWLDASHNYITELCDSPYLQDLSFLDVSENAIDRICDNVLKALEFGNLQGLDLSDNNMKDLPKEIMELTSLKRLWLGGNPLNCDCWMIGWTFWRPDQNHVVQDIYQIFCANFKKLLVEISPVQMKCFPNTTWLMIIYYGRLASHCVH